MDMNIILLSLSSHDQTIYRASAVKHFLCRHKKGHIDRYQQSILCECPLVTGSQPVARRGSWCEPPTKLKLGPHLAPGLAAREAPSRQREPAPENGEICIGFLRCSPI